MTGQQLGYWQGEWLHAEMNREELASNCKEKSEQMQELHSF
jgi:hypothetical protein